MAGRLAGKVALITGAARGIGLALAEAFAAEGAKLALCAKTAAPKLSGAYAEAFDVADAAACAAFAAAAEKRFGGIDVLVNNAGVLGPRGELAACPPAEWERVMRVNVDGPLYMLRAVVPAMRRRGGGVVLNVSSGAGKTARKLGGPYAVSKFALEGLTRVAAEELEADGIRVIAVNPGPTRTAMRAAYAPAEDPKTVKPPEAVCEAFIGLILGEHPGARSVDLGPDGRVL